MLWIGKEFADEPLDGWIIAKELPHERETICGHNLDHDDPTTLASCM
jgi:hypothetical protein